MNSEDEKKEKKNVKKKVTKKSDTTNTKKKTVKKEDNVVKEEKKETNKKEEKIEDAKIELEEKVDEEKVESASKSLQKETKKETKVKDKEKATLLQRIIAYIIDVLLVSFVASLLVFPFVNDESKIDKLNDEMMEVVEKYQKNEISIKTYATEMESLTYQIAKSNGTVALITLVCEILYFIVFQLYNGGQTIGKKILKIKVISDNGSLTMNQMICRCLIVNSILLEILSFAFMLFASKTVYFYGVATMEMIEYLVLIISAFMIMGSLDGRGVHDRLAHTRVIKL